MRVKLPLKFRTPGNFQGTIQGFDIGDTLDLDGTTIYDAVEAGSNLEVMTSESGSREPVDLPALHRRVQCCCSLKQRPWRQQNYDIGERREHYGRHKCDRNKSATGGDLLDRTQLGQVKYAITAAVNQYGDASWRNGES